jgi:hypothetical protein
MAALALKAIDYGAEQIPDRFFEKIPGGFFTPEEKKKNRANRKKHQDEKRREEDSRRPQRNRSRQTGYSSHSDGESDYERERRRRDRDRDRARSVSRGRDLHSKDLNKDLIEDFDGRDMAYAEQGQASGPYFPPPPTSEYRQYDPRDYSPRPSQDEYRPASAMPSYGYPPQVNFSFPSRSSTFPLTAAHPTPVNSCPPALMGQPPPQSQAPMSFPSSRSSFPSRGLGYFLHGTPLSAGFSPSYEPPLATLLQRPPTNTLQPAPNQHYATQSPVGRRDGTSPPAVAYGDEAAYRYETIQNSKAGQAQQPSSYTAARYTPGPGYAPSPVSMPQAPIPPPPVGVNSPPLGSNAPYAPYDPSTYGSYNPASQANGNARPSQPPFYRQHSRSQPSILPEPSSPYPGYAPRSSQQVTQYDYPPSSRRSSTKPERRDRHRARSADSRNDRNRENSRMSDIRGRFDDMDLQKKGLAAAVGGALAGGFAGRAMGKGKTSRLTTLAGAAAGALGGQAIVNRTGE